MKKQKAKLRSEILKLSGATDAASNDESRQKPQLGLRIEKGRAGETLRQKTHKPRS